MNITDLPDLMDERYEADTVPVLSGTRIDGIRGKVAAARRRTVGAVAAALVLVAGTVFGLTHITTRSAHPGPAATDTTVLVDGFPEWAYGGRVIAAQTAPLAGGTVSLTVTPAVLDFSFDERCSPVGGDQRLMLTVVLKADGHTISTSSGSCNGGGNSRPDPSLWSGIGLRVGTPATFTLTVTRAEYLDTGYTTSRPVAVPPGELSLAVRQQVPFDQYHFPPRPDPLPAFDPTVVGQGPGAHAVSSSAGDPQLPQSITLVWPQAASSTDVFQYEANSQTPGYLYLSVDGKPLVTAEFWTYYSAAVGGSSVGFVSADYLLTLGVHVTPGQTVTFTVEPAQTTGAWAVSFAEVSFADQTQH